MKAVRLLVFVICVFFLGELPVCHSEATDDKMLTIKMNERVERLEKQLETYRNELRDYRMKQEAVQKTISEDTKKLREGMEILDKFSAKSISFAAYTLSGVALILSGVNIFLVFHIGSTYKDTRRVIKNAKTKAGEEFQKQLDIFTERIEKIKLDTSRMAEQFIVAMDNKRKIVDKLTISIGERIRKKVPKRDILGILDDIFSEELDKHEVESFIADLRSPDKEVKERAVWGIEGMGPEKLGRDKTIEILQKVMDDPGEDPEIRLQAQRSIENIRRGVIV